MNIELTYKQENELDELKDDPKELLADSKSQLKEEIRGLKESWSD